MTLRISTLALLACLLCTSIAGSAVSNERPTVAVVLGGGAARGFSHIGLLKALEEHGIPIDIVVGTSMGSIVAGLYASGLSTDNLAYLVTNVDLSSFFTPLVPPKGGIVQTDDFQRFLDLLTDNAQLETLPVPFYSVITNVVTGEEVALHEGPVGRGIAASMSIPGMFPPVHIDGAYYVDGGMLSPVPVAAAKAHGADFIIAVDVRRSLEHIDHDNFLTNLQLSLYFLLDSNTENQIGDADVVIRPRVEHNSYMEYDLAAEFIKEGYDIALQHLDAIRNGLLQKDPNFPFGVQPPQAGLPADVFAQKVETAIDDAHSGPQPGPTVGLGFQFRTDERPAMNFSFGLPVGRLTKSLPVAAKYGLTVGPRGSTTLGLDVGLCQEQCLSLYGRKMHSEHGWLPGAATSGRLGEAFRYTATWETSVGETPQWHVSLSNPAPAALTQKGYEILVQARQDPRGLHGPPQETTTVDLLYRHYFIGSLKNHLELLRGSANWYVGAGVTSAIAAQPAVNPLGEVGLLLEGRLFGLYPIRSRISATYDGGEQEWTFRWLFGD